VGSFNSKRKTLRGVEFGSKSQIINWGEGKVRENTMQGE